MSSDLFPYARDLTIEGRTWSVQDVLERISPHFLPDRIEKLRRVAAHRTYHVSVLTEYFYDTGNINAVMRTAENLGIQSFHIVEATQTHISQRTTKGAEKWIDQHRWKTTHDAFTYLKSKNYQIVATTLSEKAIPFTEVDFTKPSVIVLGCEHDGISTYAEENADVHCIIPTVGLSQSFNVSVAASIILGKLMIDRGLKSELDQVQQDRLLAEFLIRDFMSSKSKRPMIGRIF
ncbi:MAG: rRNA methyltransferase [Bdellovibrio sp. CG12_big_fil_rev_8_21_14_0_65_39_13]|nr:MAG: rRNA methyltransferase [Bdellovibrio sp. CG22_combo_CG10-13_8_21_14_all_39_27]PIQ57744.1 MAG: rRNA methyltransferase [Bdellovibrio sp. CG12_big_fil_rev_8_21_14_0_65_39_13]PIR34974.1 MAG: rRNA methyltransferase [Bdellovibrio sp. CG11_big_fil_rev_8_21_14_0_20_39_38]PJB53027.1 MAG: TrmH family RNA methyltransferase [Bdellovibrio sp. CG_4_9_14_3_um_filter_39_7]